MVDKLNCEDNPAAGYCYLSATNNTSAMGWLGKSNFVSDGDHAAHLGLARECVLFHELTVTSRSERHKSESRRIMRSIHFWIKGSLSQFSLSTITNHFVSLRLRVFTRSLKTIPCGETIYQAFCLYTCSLLRCHRASPPYFIVPPSSLFSSSLQSPLTACLIVFVRVHCILNALSREHTMCAVESQTDYLPCLESQ